MDIKDLHALVQKQGSDNIQSVPLADFLDEVRKVAREELDQMPIKCRFPETSADDLQKMKTFNGAIGSLAEGDHRHAIEIVRENHQFTSKIRKRGDRISMGATIALTMAIVAGLIAAFWAGLKELILKVGP